MSVGSKFAQWPEWVSWRKSSSYCVIWYFQSGQKGCHPANMFEIYGELSDNVRVIRALSIRSAARIGVMAERFQLMSDKNFQSSQNGCHPANMFEIYG